MKKHTNGPVPRETQAVNSKTGTNPTSVKNVPKNEKQPEANETVKTKEQKKEYASPDKSVALYMLWFGLDCGSILIAYVLYNTIVELEQKPYLIQNDPSLRNDHYADKGNIVEKFIYDNCDILDTLTNDLDRQYLDSIGTHIVDSDVMWDNDVINNSDDMYFYFRNIKQDDVKKYIWDFICYQF